jgi:hypothetical protein
MKTVSTVDGTKRLAIATKQAHMKALQNLLISNEEKFIQDCTEDEIRKRLQDMLEDDRKNLGVLDTAIVQCGVQSELQETTQNLIKKIG